MTQRFTNDAKQAINLAQSAAAYHGHNYIGTEHLLIGIIRAESGMGAKALSIHNLHSTKLDQLHFSLTDIIGDWC